MNTGSTAETYSKKIQPNAVMISNLVVIAVPLDGLVLLYALFWAGSIFLYLWHQLLKDHYGTCESLLNLLTVNTPIVQIITEDSFEIKLELKFVTLATRIYFTLERFLIKHRLKEELII